MLKNWRMEASKSSPQELTAWSLLVAQYGVSFRDPEFSISTLPNENASMEIHDTEQAGTMTQERTLNPLDWQGSNEAGRKTTSVQTILQKSNSRDMMHARVAVDNQDHG